MRIAVLILTLIIGLGGGRAAAQDDEIEAAPASSSFLPDVVEIGSDWTETRRYGLDLPTDIFREGSAAVYAGPAGARVVVLVYLTTDSRVAVRQSWEEATKTFDSYRYSVATNYDYEQIGRLDAMEPPEGCVEAKRAEGTDDKFGFQAGVTMCAIDPDAILLVVVSGTALELAGYQASDAIVDLAIAAP